MTGLTREIIRFAPTVLAAGNGSQHIDNISFQKFINYLDSIAKGEDASVTVIRENGVKITLHAIAP